MRKRPRQGQLMRTATTKLTVRISMPMRYAISRWWRSTLAGSGASVMEITSG